MTVRDLDRLITRTEITPISRRALKNVRTAVMSGRVSEPDIGGLSWSIKIQTDGDYPAKMTFSFRRD